MLDEDGYYEGSVNLKEKNVVVFVELRCPDWWGWGEVCVGGLFPAPSPSLKSSFGLAGKS